MLVFVPLGAAVSGLGQTCSEVYVDKTVHDFVHIIRRDPPFPGVSWCFELSQSLRILSGLCFQVNFVLYETNFQRHAGATYHRQSERLDLTSRSVVRDQIKQQNPR